MRWSELVEIGSPASKLSGASPRSSSSWVIWGLLFVPSCSDQPILPASIRILLATPLSILLNGGFAVRIFFVLSGFVLSLSYFRKNKIEVVTSAAARRYPRLMLPALASVMFGWVLLKLGCYWNTEAAALMQQPPVWLSLWFNQDRTLLDALREGAFGPFFHYETARTLNSNLWTMPWEWGGSLIVFSMLALFGWLRSRFVIYAIVAAVFYFMAWMFFIDFLAGLVLCDLFTRHEKTAKSISPVWPVIAVLSGLIFAGLLNTWPGASGDSLHEYFAPYWPTVPAVLIIGGIAFSSTLQRALEGRIMSFLGTISFPLYLFHLSIICSVTSGLYIYLRGAAVSHIGSALISSAVTVLFLLLLSRALYFILELPSLFLARRIGQWFMRDDKAPS